MASAEVFVSYSALPMCLSQIRVLFLVPDKSLQHSPHSALAVLLLYPGGNFSWIPFIQQTSQKGTISNHNNHGLL